VKGADAIISTIVSELDKLGDKVYEELKIDPSKLAEKLIDPVSSTLKDSAQRINAILQEGANSFSSGCQYTGVNAPRLARRRTRFHGLGCPVCESPQAFCLQHGNQAKLSTSCRWVSSMNLQRSSGSTDRRTRTPAESERPCSDQGRRSHRSDQAQRHRRCRPEFQQAALALTNLKDRAAISELCHRLRATAERA